MVNPQYSACIFPNLFAFKEGMLFRAHHYYYDMVGIRMRSNEHLTLQNINIFSCVGHGLAVSGTQNIGSS
ncbi:MAG: hypothetical protein ACLUKN_04030 [Bacilli bacterium]